MSESGSLSVGVNVDIQRTDGRIHSAVVSSLNQKNKTVTVEWYEKGESKGKEIDFRTIFSLNPSYVTKEVKVIADSNVEGAKVVPNSPMPHVTSPVLAQYSRATVSNRPEAISKIAQPTVITKIAQPVTSNIKPPISTRVTAPAKTLSQITDDEDRTEIDVTDTSFDKQGLKNAKKSNCVKEVEKIQQRREERRAVQRAVKEQPDYDPSNPNYDFLMMIKEYQSTLDYNPLNDNEAIEYHQISVCLRKRPLNKKEIGRKEIDVVVVPNKQTVILHEPKLKVDLTKYLENQQFRFDYAFDEFVDNATVYRFTAKPLVECIFDKGMATCFAYGQTGSGKTHTMGGEFQQKGQQNTSGGIYAFAATDLFRLLNNKYNNLDLIVQVAFFEIYGGKVFDLLNKKEKLRILEDHKNQVQIVGLKTSNVNNVDEVLSLLQLGNLSRTSGQTSANQHSSRSHAVFQMILKKRLTNQLWGKFSLIDLAGNERGADTCSSDRNTRMEGAEINKSLLALKECIRALGRKGAHRPFRASKLTQVLRDSFIGNKSRTCMIAMISPGMHSCEHTLNTLRYADRVKELGPANSHDELPQTGNINQHISAGGDIADNDCRMKARNTNNSNNYFDKTLENMSEDDEQYADEEYEDNEYNADDLAMLRSANADIIDDEMFDFQELVNRIEEFEDAVCEKHKHIVENFPIQFKKHSALFKMTKQVAYPLEEYTTKLDQLLEEQINELMDLKENVQCLRSALSREEEISNTLLSNNDNRR